MSLGNMSQCLEVLYFPLSPWKRIIVRATVFEWSSFPAFHPQTVVFADSPGKRKNFADIRRWKNVRRKIRQKGMDVEWNPWKSWKYGLRQISESRMRADLKTVRFCWLRNCWMNERRNGVRFRNGRVLLVFAVYDSSTAYLENGFQCGSANVFLASLVRFAAVVFRILFFSFRCRAELF